MVKRRRIEALADKAARRVARAEIGPLTDKRVGEKALSRYTAAVNQFCSWILLWHITPALSYDVLDKQLIQYLEIL